MSIIAKIHDERDAGAVERALRGAAEELYYAACFADDVKTKGESHAPYADAQAQVARAVTFFAVSKVADYDVCDLDLALERVRERNLPPLEAMHAYYDALAEYVNLKQQEESK